MRASRITRFPSTMVGARWQQARSMSLAVYILVCIRTIIWVRKKNLSSYGKFTLLLMYFWTIILSYHHNNHESSQIFYAGPLGARLLTRVYCLCLQEYEDKLARLQADYHAEQKSRAKLQEDIAFLRSEYKCRISEKASTSRGSSVLKDVGKLSSNDQCKFTALSNSNNPNIQLPYLWIFNAVLCPQLFLKIKIHLFVFFSILRPKGFSSKAKNSHYYQLCFSKTPTAP